MSTVPFLPSARPRLTRELCLARSPHVVDTQVVTVIAFRGYYHQQESDNERGKYDDAVCIVGPDHYSTYNFNVDPSAFRDRIASLAAGEYRYKPGIHGLSKPRDRQYQAYVQNSKVTVKRDHAATETGYFGINIHRGSSSGTSSLGCQTVPPAQWDAFNHALLDQLKRAGQKDFRYLLIDQPNPPS